VPPIEFKSISIHVRSNYIRSPVLIASVSRSQGRQLDETWWLFFFVGLFAQLVDGALGMAFGVTATTVMLSFGTSPAQASAMVHIAEIFTTAASGASHWWHRNIDWGIVRRIAIPGVVGGILGATILVNVDGKIIAPFVTIYLALMGVLILVRALRAFAIVEPSKRGMPVVGFGGGMLDAIGGGGWGPIVTSTLVGTGHVPRYVIGSVNLTEFFVTVATSVTLILSLGLADLTPVIPLIIGGLVSAPFAGYLVKVISTRLLMLLVGGLIILLSLRSLLRLMGWL
jgi:uncharacterized membrane protein YfcA